MTHTPLYKTAFAALELSQGENMKRGEREGEFRQRDENPLDLWHGRTVGKTKGEQAREEKGREGMERKYRLAFSL